MFMRQRSTGGQIEEYSGPYERHPGWRQRRSMSVWATGRRGVATVARCQVHDLPAPLPLTVTEHRAHMVCCPDCRTRTRVAFPADVAGPVPCGPRLEALAAYLPVARLRALRMAKLQMKIAGGFRTRAGAKRFAQMRGLIETARQREWHLLDLLRRRRDPAASRHALTRHGLSPGLQADRTGVPEQ